MVLTLRLSDDDARVRRELAEAEGLSQQEAVVCAVREAAERRGHRARVAEASAAARQRYAEVLDRLGR